MVKTGQIAAHLIPPRCVTIRFEGTRRIASLYLSIIQNARNLYVRFYPRKRTKLAAMEIARDVKLSTGPLRRQRVGSASARPRGYAGRQPFEGVIQITADNANLWFYGSYQRELSEYALTHIGEALAESLWSLRFHKDIAMRFEIQKDVISGQWCVLDCYASNRNVSSHKLISVAKLAKLQYEQMWDNYKIENGIAA